MKKITLIIFSFLSVLIAANTTIALAAANLQYQFPVNPGLGLGAGADTGTITGYIVRLYQFSISIAGILAVGMIVAGAIYRSVSAGRPDKISEGNSMITSALWGLLLLLGSYIVLRTINPQLVSLAPPNAPFVTSTATWASPHASSTCPDPSQGACFFDPNAPTSTAALNINDPNAKGTAYDAATPACDGSAPYPAGRTSCACQNCQPLVPRLSSGALAYFPVKNTACSTGFAGQSQNGLHNICFLEKNTKDALFKLISRAPIEHMGDGIIFSNEIGDWRITEAFPPVSQHSSPRHYDGTAFDLSRAPGLTWKSFTSSTTGSIEASDLICKQIKDIAQTGGNLFGRVLIEARQLTAGEGDPPAPVDMSELQYCIHRGILQEGTANGQVQSTEHTTGIHIHFEGAK